jgi:hypothetical protein
MSVLGKNTTLSASLILDPNISEIMVNGGTQLFIEPAGQLEAVPDINLSEAALGATSLHD